MEWEPTDGTGKATALRKSTCLFGSKTFPRTVLGSPPAPDSSWKRLSKQSQGVLCHGWRCPCSSALLARGSLQPHCHWKGSLEQMNKPGGGSSTQIPAAFAVSKGAPCSLSTQPSRADNVSCQRGWQGTALPAAPACHKHLGSSGTRPVWIKQLLEGEKSLL